MQLKYNRQPSFGSFLLRTFVKLLLVIIIFILFIFLVEKINFPSPEKNTILILQMILKNFSKFLSLLILFIFAFNVQADEKIDIWKNKNLQKIKI